VERFDLLGFFSELLLEVGEEVAVRVVQSAVDEFGVGAADDQGAGDVRVSDGELHRDLPAVAPACDDRLVQTQGAAERSDVVRQERVRQGGAGAGRAP
jgi:hypothetical protein